MDSSYCKSCIHYKKDCFMSGTFECGGVGYEEGTMCKANNTKITQKSIIIM